MATKSDKLKEKLARFAESAGYQPTDLPKGLELYATHLFARENSLQSSLLAGDDWKEADLSQFNCGGAGDGNFDSILYSSDSDRVIAIQAKYRSAKIPPAELLDEVGKLRDAFTRLDNKAYRLENLNAKTRELVEESQIYKRSKSVSIYLVTNQQIGELKEVRQRCKELNEEMESLRYNVEFAVFGSAELAEQEESFEFADTGQLVKSQEVVFAADSFFEFESDGKAAVVGVLKGNAVAALYRQQKDALFNLNVRGYLGAKGINAAIIRTAQDPEESDNFFYYNNGITATCSTLESLGDGKFLANNLQVVNGAQTVKSLDHALRDSPNSKVMVLFRLIETNQKNRNKSKFADNIARFQNTQNKVLDSDFFGNYPIQLWIENNFSKTWSGKNNFVKAFYYERRRADIAPGHAPGKKITIQELGKLRHAFLHGPKVAYGSAKTIWDTDSKDRFWEAFGRKDENGDWSEVESWTKEELAEVAWAIHTWLYLHQVVKDERKKEGAGKASSDFEIPEVNYLRNLSFWVVAATAVGIRNMINEEKLDDFQTLMHSEKNWKKFTVPMLNEARKILSREITALYSSGQANPRLNLPQNDDIWRRTKQEMAMAAKLTEFSGE